jgi:hypothetical protein
VRDVCYEETSTEGPLGLQADTASALVGRFEDRDVVNAEEDLIPNNFGNALTPGGRLVKIVDEAPRRIASARIVGGLHDASGRGRKPNATAAALLS